jgi:hypothetical protein
MKLSIATLLGAALLCGSLAVNAQSPGGPGKGPMGEHRMKPCSQEPDPAKCEATRKEMRERVKAMHESCKDKTDRRACMTEQYCAKSPDPAKCQAQARERQAKMGQHMDARQAAAEACTGKRGDELHKCMGEQREKHRARKPDTKG